MQHISTVQNDQMRQVYHATERFSEANVSGSYGLLRRHNFQFATAYSCCSCLHPCLGRSEELGPLRVVPGLFFLPKLPDLKLPVM